MSLTYVKSKKLFDVLPQYRVDQSQISNRTTGVEYITFHNRNTYSNIRLRIPSGTEVVGVIVRKISNSQTARTTAPTPPPDVLDEPADLSDSPANGRITNFYTNGEDDSWNISQNLRLCNNCKA